MKLFEIHSEDDGSLYMVYLVNDQRIPMTLVESISALEILIARAYQGQQATQKEYVEKTHTVNIKQVAVDGKRQHIEKSNSLWQFG